MTPIPSSILIADDDPGVRAGLAAACRSAGHDTLEATSGREALALAADRSPEVVLLGLDAPQGVEQGAGLDVLPELLAGQRAPAVIVLTDSADVPTAVRAMQLGAANLLEKPVRPSELERALTQAFESRGAPFEQAAGEPAWPSGPLVGHSAGIHRVLEHVQRVASTPRTTVLVTGESGVGKEIVARAVHEHSSRREQPFVAINCAALAESLLEAELFGYEPGAFTGGDPKGRDGLLAAAEGGSLLLDEVGELAPRLQAKLLRVLQERSYRKVGGAGDRSMDVRVIASTNRDLVAMVEEGTFREDLYYRLNVLSVHVPPLREHAEDIAPIATHFLVRFGTELVREFTGFSESTMERLLAHAWPGNVRELKNTVERAAILSPGGQVLPEHLGLDFGPARPRSSETRDRQLPLASWKLRHMEEVLIRRVLEECVGNRSRAARELGINRTTLYSKLRSYGIQG